jgi:SPX domain protein involved in polyphosphate accumulation
MPVLTTREREFLQALDAQLSKIESFYLDRESEMQSRGEVIQEQIRELVVHRALWKTHVCDLLDRSNTFSAADVILDRK